MIYMGILYMMRSFETIVRARQALAVMLAVGCRKTDETVSR